jgi:UDP-N-acetylmuramoyl-L-alanyl-D-glutamate--2,6-diaminopimelate ligase
VLAGAVAIICEEPPAALPEHVTCVEVTHSAKAAGVMASHFYGDPSSKLHLIGITGTNGKTTTVTLLFELFRRSGYRCGLISTIKNRIGDRELPATHTTPDPVSLQKLLAEMVESECTHCFMEVSSHAADQDRIAGLTFTGGVFTNLTHDHLDYHKTFDAYLRAKKSFFDILPKDAFALTNKDDRNGMVMLQNTTARPYTYSLRSVADFRARVVENQSHGLELEIDGREAWFRLIGRFNAYNLLVAYAVGILLGKEKDEVLTILTSVEPVEGRFNYLYSPAGVTAVVDYAHTPDALKNVIGTIRDILEDGKLITVVGAGGNRDASKRPLMAKISCEESDTLILTSDNPREEDPDEILRQMSEGIPAGDKHKVLIIAGRREAIKTAALLARPGDIILVAGKGHETYQEIKGVKHPFDDKEVLREAFGIKRIETDNQNI